VRSAFTRLGPVSLLTAVFVWVVATTLCGTRALPQLASSSCCAACAGHKGAAKAVACCCDSLKSLAKQEVAAAPGAVPGPAVPLDHPLHAPAIAAAAPAPAAAGCSTFAEFLLRSCRFAQAPPLACS
jgi:hypothetical protein